jgi:ribulose kinase
MSIGPFWRGWPTPSGRGRSASKAAAAFPSGDPCRRRRFQSDAALQLTADIFGIPVARPHVYDASGLGAAIDAAVGLKLHRDFDTAVARMTRVGRVFDPDPGNQDIYERLYQRVYRQMYRRLKPLYEELRRIIP